MYSGNVMIDSSLYFGPGKRREVDVFKKAYGFEQRIVETISENSFIF